MLVDKPWQDFKANVATKSLLRYRDRGDFYLLTYGDFECSILKDSGADQTEFETDYLPSANSHAVSEVVTQMEKNDKTLRSLCAFADTDSNGEATFKIPVPAPGRWIAYGDAEFEVRHFGDRLSKVEVADLDETIPEGYRPEGWPILGHYDERGFPDPMPANAAGTIYGGIGMSFQYGSTESQPIGGYGWLPGGLYLVIVCKKGGGQTTGHKAQISIDWAEQTS